MDRYCVRACAALTAPTPEMSSVADEEWISVASRGVAATTTTLDVVILAGHSVRTRDTLDDDRQAEQRDQRRRRDADVDAGADQRVGRGLHVRSVDDRNRLCHAQRAIRHRPRK